MAIAKSARTPRLAGGKSDPDSSPKQVRATMAFPVTSFQKSFYFNRFRIEAVDEYLMTTFAFVRVSGEVLCCFRCFIGKSEVEGMKQPLTSFIAANLEDVQLPPQHHFEPPAANPNQVDAPAVNQINGAVQTGNVTAELTLTRYSMVTLANVQQLETSEKPKIPVEGIALFRCDVGLFKLFVVKLFEAIEPVAP